MSPENSVVPQQEQEIKMTPYMLRVQDKIALEGETLADAFRRMNSIEGLSIQVISGVTGVDHNTLEKWMKRVGYVNLKRMSDESNARRRESILQKWDNSREDLVARIHTPESRVKRSVTMTRLHKEGLHSKIKPEQYLGTNPKGLLERLYWQDNLSTIVIAGLIRQTYGQAISRSLVATWLRELGIKPKSRSEAIKGRKIVRKPNGGRIKSDSVDLVTLAREKGLVGLLPDRDQYVLGRRLPEVGKPASLDEIAQELGGLTREAVRQMQVKALDKLKRLISGESIDVNKQNNNPDFLGSDPKKTLDDLFIQFGTLAKVADALSVSKGKVSGLFVRYGVETQPLLAAKEQNVYVGLGENPRQRLQDMHFKDGYDVSFIARVLGVRVATVRFWMNDLNIPILK